MNLRRYWDSRYGHDPDISSSTHAHWHCINTLTCLRFKWIHAPKFPSAGVYTILSGAIGTWLHLALFAHYHSSAYTIHFSLVFSWPLLPSLTSPDVTPPATNATAIKRDLKSLTLASELHFLAIPNNICTSTPHHTLIKKGTDWTRMGKPVITNTYKRSCFIATEFANVQVPIPSFKCLQ